MTNIPEPLKKLAGKTLSNAANKFVDFVITRFTGKSIKVFEAESDVEADKVKSRWEMLEKPFWLQAEAKKMGRQYSNLGNILLKTTPLIENHHNKVTGDNDVFWGLLEHSKEISNEEMQELIAKIIAGEYNTPGTYSMSTLQTLKMLGKKELELFERVGSLIINGDQIPQEVFSNMKDFLKELAVDFESLQILQNLGLFLPNDMSKVISNLERKKYQLQYFNKQILYTPSNETVDKIRLPGHYALSDIGKQILQHLRPMKNNTYFQWLRENYRIPGYDIEK